MSSCLFPTQPPRRFFPCWYITFLQHLQCSAGCVWQQWNVNTVRGILLLNTLLLLQWVLWSKVKEWIFLDTHIESTLLLQYDNCSQCTNGREIQCYHDEMQLYCSQVHNEMESRRPSQRPWPHHRVCKTMWWLHRCLRSQLETRFIHLSICYSEVCSVCSLLWGCLGCAASRNSKAVKYDMVLLGGQWFVVCDSKQALTILECNQALK